jgi:hypothetical protein
VADEDLERIASGYRAFAEEAATESPLYSRLASAVADARIPLLVAHDPFGLADLLAKGEQPPA